MSARFIDFPMRSIAIALLPTLIAACSDGGDPIATNGSTDSPTPERPYIVSYDEDAETPEGVYVGKMVSDLSQEAKDLIAFVEGWGFIRLATSEGQYYGFVPGRLTGIAAAGGVWSDGSTRYEFQFDRSEDSAFDLSGTYSGAGDKGLWSLTRETLTQWYPEDGVYVILDENLNTGAAFQLTNGRELYGSNDDGCVFSGDLRRDDWDFTFVYDVLLTVSNCLQTAEVNLDGEYGGMGGLLNYVRGAEEEPDLAIAVTNTKQAITLILQKL